ncbi:MAG TPA: sulfotransferase [Rhizomicrobium sp.]|jgi:tetratricopeptide (TPR) repeat protein|nr:sulfotransferase [Rhizomicrobium sp.]
MPQESSRPPTTLWARVDQAAALVERDPATAESLAVEILRQTPGQPEALAVLVSARCRSNDHAGARRLLESFAGETPGIAAIHYELGVLLSEMGNFDEAMEALSRAVEREPRHPEALDALANIRRKQAAAPRRLETGRPREMETAACGSADQLPRAETLLREWLQVHPTEVWALHMLGNVYIRQKRNREAEQALVQALALAPDFSGARWMLAGTYFYRGNWERTLAQVEKLLARNPENPDYVQLKADALLHSGEIDAALACHEDLLSKQPGAEHWTYYGRALRAAGRQAEAIAAYRKAVALKPEFDLVWWCLADLKTFRFMPSDIESMRAALEKPDLTGKKRARLNFALGKAFEDEKQYALSFAHYERGNAEVRAYTPYDAEMWTARMRESKRLFTESFLHDCRDWGHPAEGPIFIVGLPRSGTTLIEQILASHSRVEATSELTALEWVAHHLTDRGDYPEFLKQATREQIRSGGDTYLSMTGNYRKLKRRFFIDKMPNNFDYLGLILLLFPKARIVDARRHPLGSGMAIFKHYMSEGNSFAFDLASIGHHYRMYVELMAHFDAVAAGRVHRVFYERLVAEPETEIRGLLDYCHLPFEEACLRFHETRRAVLTPSSEQVRRPIYTEAAELWREFEPWLGPLKSALGDVLECYPGVPKFDEAAAPAEWRISFTSSTGLVGQPFNSTVSLSRRTPPSRRP